MTVSDNARPSQVFDELYTNSKYLALTSGTWHLEDAPFKAKYVAQMIARHQLAPRTLCEIGCGAGGILHELATKWQDGIDFTGYEISLQAHELSRQFTRTRLRFINGDAFADKTTYDAVLVMDVVEHVEDCFGFLRRVRDKGTYKIYHFPLEITCTSALRDLIGGGYALGHLHHFSFSSTLAALEHTGHRVIDWIYTPVGFECAKQMRTRMMNGVRRLLPASLATRLLGGYSLLVLAQ